jgi:hypothetical protein
MICETPEQAETQRQMIADLMKYRHDPLRAVAYGFTWGEGELRHSKGPRKWQKQLLQDIGNHLSNPETRFTPFKAAISSGHGIGKSAEVALIIWWALSTFEDCRVNVTANTKGQLDTKTQPEVSTWFRRCINRNWFEVNVASIRVLEPGHEKTWRCDFVPWSEDNPAAFAGSHNKDKRLLLIMDEASEISATISAEVGRGALTDANTEIIWLKFGNPTLNSGDFYDCVHGNQRHLWKHYIIDSREVEGINLQELKEWEDLYGEDSDFFRVRVKGLPPRAASGQFIDQELIKNAQRRIPRSLPDEPLVAGVDFAWGGSDDNVIRFRKGHDASCVPPIKIKGEFTRDPAVMTGKLADVLRRDYIINGRAEKLAMLFFDSAGIAAPVESRIRDLGHRNIMVVNFGADSANPRYAYMRDYMWGQMKEWLMQGTIDKDAGLEADLGKPVLVTDQKQRVKLEPKDVMKKRLAKMGVESSSPDDGDALALTFAMPVSAKKPAEPPPQRSFAGPLNQGFMR